METGYLGLCCCVEFWITKDTGTCGKLWGLADSNLCTCSATQTPLISTEFKRLQFPVRLAFTMSINKTQGQPFKVTGVDLTEPCFSHGQLYVAL